MTRKFVARTFGDLSTGGGKFAGAFENVVFAIYAHSPGRDTYQAFANVFGNKPSTSPSMSN